MDQYTITGMSCAACSARVEKAVLQVPGVSKCSVNLLTNSMGVEGSAQAQAIISAVEKAGYGARQKGAQQQAAAAGRGGGACGQGNACAQAKACRIGCAGARADVFFNGPYDVGVSRAGVFGG